MGEIDRPKMTLPDEEPQRRRHVSWPRLAAWLVITVVMMIGGVLSQIEQWIGALILFALIAMMIIYPATKFFMPYRDE